MAHALVSKREYLQPFLHLMLRDDIVAWHISKTNKVGKEGGVVCGNGGLVLCGVGVLVSIMILGSNQDMDGWLDGCSLARHHPRPPLCAQVVSEQEQRLMERQLVDRVNKNVQKVMDRLGYNTPELPGPTKVR